MQHTDPSRFLILRLKIFECDLTRNIAKFGKMNPFVEVNWNEDKWKTQVQSGGHQTATWNEGHIFESPDPAPLTLKVLHSGLLFTQQEIGSGFLSTEELSSGKSKDWLDLYFEGKSAGKLLISAFMYEERRSEQSTHTTSYASINLKEEYTRKQNELELEKEELEFYKRKYKRKLEKLNQEKRNYQHKVKEIVKKATPKHTEESYSDEYGNISSPGIIITDEERNTIQRENFGYVKEFIDGDLTRFRREKHKTGTQRKVVAYSQGKLSDIAKSLDMVNVPNMKKSTSEVKVCVETGKFTADWQEVEDIKKRLLAAHDEECNDELLELKLDMSKPFSTPRRTGFE